MTITERAIEHFEGMVRLAQNRHPHPDLEFWQAALDALRLQHEAEENEPLTLEELREMDGQPVYIVPKDWWCGKKEYAIADKNLCRCASVSNSYIFEEYRRLWLAYRHPPKEAHND